MFSKQISKLKAQKLMHTSFYLGHNSKIWFTSVVTSYNPISENNPNSEDNLFQRTTNFRGRPHFRRQPCFRGHLFQPISEDYHISECKTPLRRDFLAVRGAEELSRINSGPGSWGGSGEDLFDSTLQYAKISPLERTTFRLQSIFRGRPHFRGQTI